MPKLNQKPRITMSFNIDELVTVCMAINNHEQLKLKFSKAHAKLYKKFMYFSSGQRRLTNDRWVII